MKKYRALKRGFDGEKIVEPGEIFEFSGPKGVWMEEVGGKVVVEHASLPKLSDKSKEKQGSRKVI